LLIGANVRHADHPRLKGSEHLIDSWVDWREKR
jgi:hypothetical protein